MNIKQAFTLIELLVVIAIIGILSGLIVVSMNGITSKASIAKSQVFSNSLRNSLMLNLISEWKFDGTGVADGGAVNSSYLQDSWSGGNTLSTSGTVYIRTGSNCVSDSCLWLNNGGTSYLTSSGTNLNPGTGSFTVEGWVFATDYTYPRTRFSIGNYTAANNVSVWGIDDVYYSDGFGIIFADGTTKIDNDLVCDNSYKPTNTINKWTHVVVVFDRSAGRVYAYVNGVKQSNSLNISAITGDVRNATMMMGSVAGWLIYGYIDGIRVYNASMPTSQIKEQYYAGLNSLFANGAINFAEYSSRISEFASIDF